MFKSPRNLSQKMNSALSKVLEFHVSDWKVTFPHCRCFAVVRYSLIYKALPHMFSLSHHTCLTRQTRNALYSPSHRQKYWSWCARRSYTLEISELLLYLGCPGSSDTFVSMTLPMSLVAPICHLWGGRSSKGQLKKLAALARRSQERWQTVWWSSIGRSECSLNLQNTWLLLLWATGKSVLEGKLFVTIDGMWGFTKDHLPRSTYHKYNNELKI